MGLLDLKRVNNALRETVFHEKLHHFRTIDSTNTLAIREAQTGTPPGQVYIADEQTAGRGRGGNVWLSEPDHGLYLTMLVRPALKSVEILKLSMVTALAALQAVEELSATRIIDLRWPNDLVIGAKPARKVGGILTEAVSTPSGEVRYAAIGLGINLNQLDFPPELAGTATSLRRELGHEISREELAIALLRQMDSELRRIDTGETYLRESETVFDRFTRASSWVCGKRVHVAENSGYTGTTAGLTAEGLLRIACDDGSAAVVRHGGVREL